MGSPYLVREGVKIDPPIPPGGDEILTLEGVAFVADLHRRFDSRHKNLPIGHGHVEAYRYL